MKIHAALFDAGTQLRKQRYHPGADTAWWTDHHSFETTIFDFPYRIPAQNEHMALTTGFDVAPWPETFPAHTWLDWTPRYNWRGTDGLAVNLHQLDQISNRFPPLPAGELRFTNDPDNILDPAEARFTPSLTWKQVQAAAPDPTDWYRLDTLNEKGGAALRAPLGLLVDGARNPLVLEVPDQSLFTPFDMRDGSDRYRLVDRNGAAMTDAQLDAGALALNPRGHYNVYLRPRRWRWFAVVYCYYLYISFFEMFYVATAVSYAWFDQPPKYPIRHNILDHPGGGDGGVNWAFDHSAAAAQLRREIFDNQWNTLSEAFVFSHIDHTELTIWKYWPLAGEYVLGVERVDGSTGRTSGAWAVTRNQEKSRYPQQQIYHDPEAPFYVTNPGGRF